MTRNGCAFEAGEFSQCVHAVVSLIAGSEMTKAIKKAVTIALRVLVYQVITVLWASSWALGSECLVQDCSELCRWWVLLPTEHMKRVSFETGLSEWLCQ